MTLAITPLFDDCAGVLVEKGRPRNGSIDSPKECPRAASDFSSSRLRIENGCGAAFSQDQQTRMSFIG